MRSIHVKFIRQLFIGLNTLQVFRKGGIQVVVDFRLPVTQKRRRQQDQERQHKRFIMPGDQRRRFIHPRDHRLMGGLLNHFVKHQKQGGQNGYAANHPADHALCHDDSQIPAQRKAHEAQCDKSCHCGDGASDHRRKCIRNCVRHSPFLVSVIVLLVLLIAVPEENGIVHGYP